MFHNIDVIEDINNIPLNFNKPYVLKNNKMAAVKKWNLDYLKHKLSNETVRTQYYKSIEEFQTERGTIIYKKFSEYISDMKNNKLCYILESELKHLENVLDKNDTTERFKFRRPIFLKHLYLGINTYSNCHIHLNDDVVLNQIFGTKIVYMFDYYDNPSIKRSIFERYHIYTNDNFWALDLSKYKLYKVVLEPGDCLLIPPWWWHAVKGIDLSCSVAFRYERTDLNYIKMSDIKIRISLFKNIELKYIIILYIIIYCILLFF